MFRNDSEAVKMAAILLGFLAFMVGISVFYGYWQSLREKRRQEALSFQSANPNEPWARRKDWATGKIANGLSDFNQKQFWAVAIGTNVIGALLVLGALTGNIGRGQTFSSSHATWASIFVPLAGVVLLYLAASARAQLKKFGCSHFVMSQVPGRPGETLKGVIIVPRPFLITKNISLTLLCLSVRGRNDKCVWETSWQLSPGAVHTTDNGTEVPVSVSIPSIDLPNSGPGPDDQEISWLLKARIPTRGLDFKATYEIPVFRNAIPKPHSDL